MLIPLYVLLHAIGLSNSLVGLALVLAMYQLPFAVFMMRIAFEGLPVELEEAAVMEASDRPAPRTHRHACRAGRSFPAKPASMRKNRRRANDGCATSLCPA